MNDIKKIFLPNIGGFKDVLVIDILVSKGQNLKSDDNLIIVESDKASMEIPSSISGILKNIFVKIGDRISQGSLIAEIEQYADMKEIKSKEDIIINDSNPQKNSSSNNSTYDYDVLVLGGGPGGYSSAFRCADLGLKTLIVEKYSTLGGVCLNVGCIPSKTLLYNAHILEEAKSLYKNGILFESPKIDLHKLRLHKNNVIKKLTDGLFMMSKLRNVDIIKGNGSFLNDHQLSIQNNENNQTVSFNYAIIATGSSPINLAFLPKDDRILNSTDALNLPIIPKKMLLIGGGIISLEMGTIYSSLGARLDLIETNNHILNGVDNDLVNIWKNSNLDRFDNIMLNTKILNANILNDGVNVTFEDKHKSINSIKYDLVLQAIGRSPNVNNIGLDKLNINITNIGFIKVDRQNRTNIKNIFAIGDVVGHPMLAHKAVHEGHVAAETISGKSSFFDVKVIPSVAYTNPEIAWAGLTESQAYAMNKKIKIGLFPWSASGRAISNSCENGLTKLIFDFYNNKILGGGIVGSHAGDLIGEIALGIEMGSDVYDISHTIHPHPTFIETVGMAAASAEGICTDLPPSELSN